VAWGRVEVSDLGQKEELWERMGLNASRNEEAANSRTLLQRTNAAQLVIDILGAPPILERLNSLSRKSFFA
jgi:hypothetical protein